MDDRNHNIDGKNAYAKADFIIYNIRISSQIQMQIIQMLLVKKLVII